WSIVLTLADGFLQKAIRPAEIAALVGDSSKDAGDLGISWRQLTRFLCVSESFLLVLKRPRVELCKLGYRGSQVRIQFLGLFKRGGGLVPVALFFVSFSQPDL